MCNEIQNLDQIYSLKLKDKQWNHIFSYSEPWLDCSVGTKCRVYLPVYM